jgi:hypothetical protein
MAEVVAWLDSARWSPENQTGIFWAPVNLPSSQSLLVHWLTCITDIRRPWQDVWNKGQKIFAEIVKLFYARSFYISGSIFETQREVKSFLDEYREKDRTRKVRTFHYGANKYTPRFPNQHDFIERTLTILAHDFNKNFVNFVARSIQKWSMDHDGLGNVARDLYFLTYSKHKLEETIALFRGEANYPQWNRFGNKRVWTSLRDYRKSPKHLELLEKALKETKGFETGKELFKIWTTDGAFRLHLLELPGDVWNTQFLKALVEPLALENNIQIKKSWAPSQKAREIFKVIGNDTFYPEQLDVSFDLSSKACENGMCSICPFGPIDLRHLCFKGNPEIRGEKFCPVVLGTCQYRLKCDPEKCPVAHDVGRELCPRGLT